MISTPVFINLYWELDRNHWLNDVGAAGPTIPRIEAATRAIAHSTYLRGLSEYGVSSWSLLPGLVLGEIPGCAWLANPLPATTQNAYDQLDQVVNCILPALNGINTNNLVLTILYPPQVAGGGDHGFCSPSAAYHESAPDPIRAVSFVPLACNQTSGSSTLSQTMSSLTHELVEAITDPISPYGYRNLSIPIGPWNGEEVADVCEGGNNGPPGQPRFTNFLSTAFGAQDMLADYWSNNKGACTTGTGGGAPHPYLTIPQGATTPVDSTMSVCGRGQNMQISLGYWQPIDSPGYPGSAVPWDLNNGVGSNTLFLNATVASPSSSPAHNSWSAGSFVRSPVADKIGFKTIKYSVEDCPSWEPLCFIGVDVLGFDQDVSMAAGDVINVTIADPSSGLELTVSKPAPAAALGTLQVTPPPGAPNNWTFFGDATQVTGQVQDSCSRYDRMTATNLGPGPIEGEPVTGIVQAAFPIPDPVGAPLNAGLSDANGNFKTTLVTDSAGLQTIYLYMGGSQTVAVHPVITNVQIAAGPTIVVHGAGFAPTPRTTVVVDGVANATVTVSADGKSLSFPTPPGYTAGGRTFIVYVDGVPSLPQSYYICEPITSCYLSQACNTTINDGCAQVQCGACTNGYSCNASHNCCPAGQEPDGTGGCVCAPPRPCRPGTSWDANLCVCSGSRF
jgi:hypothetical protein